MLERSFAVLALAVVLGAVLAVLHLRPSGLRPSWPVGLVHGAIGAAGLALLIASLGGSSRGATNGTAEFGTFAAALIALALLAGLGLLAMLSSGRRPGVLIAVHATLAITGFVILAAYLFAS